MWTTALQDRKSKISDKGKIFDISLTGRSKTQDKNQRHLKEKKLTDSEGGYSALSRIILFQGSSFPKRQLPS